MNYSVKITDFEGPLDLLLHLIKESSIDIYNIKIEEIAKQYLDFISEMEKLNLDIASEYLVMAAQLIEMKSSMLLPSKKTDSLEEEYEEDPREALINRLLEYKKYKEVTNDFKNLEEARQEYFTKEMSNLKDYAKESTLEGDLNLDDLMNAFKKFLEDKAKEQPLSTKITSKEYSVSARSSEIKNILKTKKKVNFTELFEIVTKDYVVVTFLSILSMARKSELVIVQDNNFNEIVLKLKEVDDE